MLRGSICKQMFDSQCRRLIGIERLFDFCHIGHTLYLLHDLKAGCCDLILHFFALLLTSSLSSSSLCLVLCGTRLFP